MLWIGALSGWIHTHVSSNVPLTILWRKHLAYRSVQMTSFHIPNPILGKCCDTWDETFRYKRQAPCLKDAFVGFSPRAQVGSNNWSLPWILIPFRNLADDLIFFGMVLFFEVLFDCIKVFSDSLMHLSLAGNRWLVNIVLSFELCHCPEGNLSTQMWNTTICLNQTLMTLVFRALLIRRTWWGRFLAATRILWITALAV